MYLPYWDEFEHEDHPDCCGRSHIYNFPSRWDIFIQYYDDEGTKVETADDVPKAFFDRSVKDALKYALNSFGGNGTKASPWRKDVGHVIEVTLTDSQATDWEPSLLKYGFKKVWRWRNHKSGNFVNSYMVDVGKVKSKLR